MDLSARIDELLNKTGSSGSVLSDEDKILFADRLNSEAQKNPERVEKFLNAMDRERLSLGADAGSHGQLREESLRSTKNPDFINRGTFYVDPRMVGQEGFDLIGESMNTLVNNRVRSLQQEKSYDILNEEDPFEGLSKEERDGLVKFQEAVVQSTEGRVEQLREDFPESFGGNAPAPSKGLSAAPALNR